MKQPGPKSVSVTPRARGRHLDERQGSRGRSGTLDLRYAPMQLVQLRSDNDRHRDSKLRSGSRKPLFPLQPQHHKCETEVQ